MGNILQTADKSPGLGEDSKLPQEVQAIIKRGMKEGFKDGYLNLSLKPIARQVMPELCKRIIELGDKVKKINLSYNHLLSIEIKARSVDGNQSIASNDATECLIPLSLTLLGEVIQQSKSLEEILLTAIHAEDSHIKAFAPYLTGNTVLKCLDFSGNPNLTDASLPFLIQMIESSKIESVRVNDTKIFNKRALVVPLARNILLAGSEEFNFTYNYKRINDDDVIKICDLMKQHGVSKLQRVFLSANGITSKGASVLLDTLIDCNSVVSWLSLSLNQLDDECIESIGQFIQNNEHLVRLELDGNKITDKGIEILSIYLIGNITLKDLNLSDNKGISNASIPPLVESIKGSQLTSVKIWSEKISPAKREEVEVALSIPISQRAIPIKSNTKSAAKASIYQHKSN